MIGDIKCSACYSVDKFGQVRTTQTTQTVGLHLM